MARNHRPRPLRQMVRVHRPTTTTPTRPHAPPHPSLKPASFPTPDPLSGLATKEPLAAPSLSSTVTGLPAESAPAPAWPDQDAFLASAAWYAEAESKSAAKLAAPEDGVEFKCHLCGVGGEAARVAGKLTIGKRTLTFEPEMVRSAVAGGVGSLSPVWYYMDMVSLAAQQQQRVEAERSARSEWVLADLHSVHFRRRNLRRCALELFFSNRSTAFFTFDSEETRVAAQKRLTRATDWLGRERDAPPAPPDTKQPGPGNLEGPGLGYENRTAANSEMSVWTQRALAFDYRYSGVGAGVAKKVLETSGLTAAWVRRELSNFDYLMHLNTIAGRSYNDLAQYPVFPWVLCDFSTPVLDLSNPAVYRDLKKPIGALHEPRMKLFMERYNEINEADEGMPKFHYGTHYSSPGSCLFYLLRLEPFTSQEVNLHDGKHDKADRMFHSLPACWEGVLTNQADVKEMIPEFFFLPDFLRNVNSLDLGTKQDDVALGDVVLPPVSKKRQY
jgi:hypothetical protein